jgi:phage gp29-like protein
MFPLDQIMRFFAPGEKVVRGGIIEARHNIDHVGEEVELPTKVEKEYGVSGSPNVSQGSIRGSFIQQEDYNDDWVGQQGVLLADKMRRSDGSVRSILQAIKLPLRRATWRVSPADENGGDEQDKKIASFCHIHLLQSDDQKDTWDVILRHILLMLDFGFSVLEKVWTVDHEGNYVLQRLAPRLPQTIKDFNVGPNGELKYIVQEAYKNGEMKEFKIPGKYAVVFSYDKEGDNYWGIPLLRFIYQHWFYKQELYRIDAIRFDRFGIGIPIGYIKENYVLKPREREEVIKLLKGLRSHERAFALLPEEIQVKIMTPESEHGGASGLMDSVDHHDVMIARAALALFLTAGSQKHGNYGTTVTWQDLFLYSLQSLALQIGQDLQRQVVRDLCNFNFDMKGRRYPKVEASTLEDTNVKELAASIYNLVLGQVIIPDDETEKHVRRLLGFPNKENGYGREELGIKGVVAGATPGQTAVNTRPDSAGVDDLSGKEPSPGTKPSKTPVLAGPIRVPGELG